MKKDFKVLDIDIYETVAFDLGDFSLLLASQLLTTDPGYEEMGMP